MNSDLVKPSREPPSGHQDNLRAIDAEAVLAAVRDVAFEWDLATDGMSWPSNVQDVLGIENLDCVAKGSGFQLLVCAEHAGTRYRSIWDSGARDQGGGVAYQLQYRLLPSGRRKMDQLWIEERGRWFAGADGKPSRVIGVLRIVDNQREELERLRRLSEHDELTGLMNRRILLGKLEATLVEVSATGRPCVLLIAAINNLAIINQTFGLEIGDEVIAMVAGRLRGQMRAGDYIGRYSTNKIGIVIHNCETGSLQTVARRLMAVVRNSTIVCSTSEISTTISIGAVQFPLHAQTSRAAVTAALEALDEARQIRQDRMVCFTPGHNAAKSRQRSVETAESVLSALEDQRMRIALQGVVHAGTRKVAFYECLLRMLGKDGSLIPAGQFIPIAEQLGLCRMIDQRVLELAVGLVRADPEIRISFNVSGLTASDHDWLVHLHRLTAGDRSLTRRLIVEITETMAIADLDETAAFVDTLKEIGCTVALDDFGAGYTSFRNLKSLAVDMVKLDGNFLQNLKGDGANRIFVQSMVELAKHFGMETVGEMVADEETAAMLKDAGLDYLQGYLFGMPQVAPLPMPVAARS